MNDGARSYRDLLVWQKAIVLVKQVYVLAAGFPKHETYGLADQMRRSAVSIPSNIAEGQARQHTTEFRQFIYMALGSAAELDTQAVIAHQLGYINDDETRDIDERLTEVRKMLHGLVAHLPSARLDH